MPETNTELSAFAARVLDLREQLRRRGPRVEQRVERRSTRRSRRRAGRRAGRRAPRRAARPRSRCRRPRRRPARAARRRRSSRARRSAPRRRARPRRGRPSPDSRRRRPRARDRGARARRESPADRRCRCPRRRRAGSHRLRVAKGEPAARALGGASDRRSRRKQGTDLRPAASVAVVRRVRPGSACAGARTSSRAARAKSATRTYTLQRRSPRFAPALPSGSGSSSMRCAMPGLEQRREAARPGERRRSHAPQLGQGGSSARQ